MILFSDEMQAALVTSALTLIAASVGFMIRAHFDQRNRLRSRVENIHEARFHLVVDLFDLSHAGEDEHDDCFKAARQRYRELLLVVEKQCQLKTGNCLHSAARAFKTQVLDPCKNNKFPNGNHMAKAVRHTADQFNDAVEEQFPGFRPDHY